MDSDNCRRFGRAVLRLLRYNFGSISSERFEKLKHTRRLPHRWPFGMVWKCVWIPTLDEMKSCQWRFSFAQVSATLVQKKVPVGMKNQSWFYVSRVEKFSFRLSSTAGTSNSRSEEKRFWTSNSRFPHWNSQNSNRTTSSVVCGTFRQQRRSSLSSCQHDTSFKTHSSLSSVASLNHNINTIGSNIHQSLLPSTIQ